MTVKELRELSNEDRVNAFKLATRGFSGSDVRWKGRAERGLTDEELRTALQFEIGIYGGSGGPGRMSLEFQGAGLKIWAGWNDVAPRMKHKPIFEGASTVRMAREVYGIRDPGDGQMSLL